MVPGVLSKFKYEAIRQSSLWLKCQSFNKCRYMGRNLDLMLKINIYGSTGCRKSVTCYENRRYEVPLDAQKR